MRDPNEYIIKKDQEWTQRWEAREVEFRKVVSEARAQYDIRMSDMTMRVNKMSETMHKQQSVILKIRDIPVIGQYLVKWAGYDDRN